VTTNIVLLTIDAWRHDFVDGLVPCLDAVADRTVRFDRMYANGPWTTPPLVSAFTGESVARHRVWFEWSVPRPNSPGLVKTLRAAGFRAPNLCYLNRLGMYANLGYDAADAPDPPHEAEDDTLVRAIRETPPPFFLWFHYKFVHLPYWQPERYRRAAGVDDDAIPPRLRDSVCTGFVVPRGEHTLLPEDRDTVRRLYASGVLRMNDWLAGVLDAIRSRPDTSLVLTSDHGEELLDHGHVGHASTAHHAHLYEEVLRIPLVVVDARARPRRIGRRAQSLDLFPTILGLAGVEAPPSYGWDLSPVVLGGPPPADDRLFYFHAARMGCPTPRALEGHFVEAVSDGRTKIVRERYDAERVALYDLTNDPEERRPVDDARRLAEWTERLARLASPEL
jgi:arylsulfatase A-like enzyme